MRAAAIADIATVGRSGSGELRGGGGVDPVADVAGSNASSVPSGILDE